MATGGPLPSANRNLPVTVEDSLGCPGTGSALVEHFETIPAAIIGDAGFAPWRFGKP